MFTTVTTIMKTLGAPWCQRYHLFLQFFMARSVRPSPNDSTKKLAERKRKIQRSTPVRAAIFVLHLIFFYSDGFPRVASICLLINVLSCRMKVAYNLFETWKPDTMIGQHCLSQLPKGLFLGEPLFSSIISFSCSLFLFAMTLARRLHIQNKFEMA